MPIKLKVLHCGYSEMGTKKRTKNRVRRWRSVTHPITRSHHGLLLAAQFVEDVVGKLDAARPQLSCREQDTGYEGVREKEGGRETEFTGYECVFLDFYFEDTQSIKEEKNCQSDDI